MSAKESEGSTSSGLAGGRRSARERTMGLLYEAECKGITPLQLLAQLAAEPDPYVCTVLRGVQEHSGEIDSLLASRAVGWELDRMPSLDRSLLRLATFELAYLPEMPSAVVIAEAVNLASLFSTDESSKFVNGILSALESQLRNGAVTTAPDVTGQISNPTQLARGAADGGDDARVD